MKNLLFTIFAIAILIGVASLEVNAQFQVGGGPIVAPQPNPLFLSAFSNKLDARLKNKSVGYSFAVVDQAGHVVGGGGGDARRAPDASPRKMTMDDKLNIASVSKTITAAAVLKLLSQKRVSLDAPVSPYLPLELEVRCKRENDYVPEATYASRRAPLSERSHLPKPPRMPRGGYRPRAEIAAAL
jgi:CubicO group peptidase (beta-lactamase class C family)